MFDSETSESLFTVMNLVDHTALYRIENNLAQSRQIRMGVGAVWFNTVMFLVVVGSVVLFLIGQYHATKQVLQPVNIAQTEMNWNNSGRSIRNAIEL